MAVAVMDTARYLDPWSGGSALAYWVLLGFLAAATAVPLLFDRVVLGFWGEALAIIAISNMWFLAVMTDGKGGRILAKFIVGTWAVVGAVLIGLGIDQHRGYRRLERRLAALKGRM